MMERPLTPKRGKRGERCPPEPEVYFYNPDRWKAISIDQRTIGPMGIMGMSIKEADDPRILPFMRRGQLQRLSWPEKPLPYGAILLRQFDLSGRRGDIVVSRTYAYGDIFLAATVLTALAAEYSNRIIFHTKSIMEPLVRNYPGVEVITGKESLQKALRGAGVYLDLDDIAERHEEFRNQVLNRIEIFHHYLGLEPQSLCPSYFITDEEIAGAENFLEQYPRPYIAISPSTMRKEKSWRYDKWSGLAAKMDTELPGTVFVFDSQDVLNIEKVIPVVGKPLRTAGALAYHMDLFVTQDSLWSHFAAALGVRQVLLASCTDGALLSKGYSDVTVLQRDVECSPCWYRFDGGKCVYGNYPACLDDMSVDEVFNVVKEKVNG